MSSEAQIRSHTVSTENIKAWIEAGMRSMGAIEDNHNVETLYFGCSVDGLGMIDRKDYVPQLVVPIIVKYKEEKFVATQ